MVTIKNGVIETCQNSAIGVMYLDIFIVTLLALGVKGLKPKCAYLLYQLVISLFNKLFQFVGLSCICVCDSNEPIIF